MSYDCTTALQPGLQKKALSQQKKANENKTKIGTEWMLPLGDRTAVEVDWEEV